MTDELPTAARVSDPGIRALYAQENRWQAWLDVEAALARAQEELGIIPKGAADAIAQKARLELPRPRAHRRGLCPHRPHDRAARLGTEPGRRRAVRRLGALGCDDAKHHPDRGFAGLAPGAPGVAAADRRGAAGDGRSRRARRRHADRRAHPRPARTAGDLRLQTGGVDRRDDPPCRASAPGGAAHFCRDAGRGCGHLRLARRRRPQGAGRDRPPARDAADAGAGAHDRRSSRRKHLPLRPCRRDIRQDRPRNLHPDENRVRRGRGAGAARHRRQLDDAAKAQSQAVPGHHRRRRPKCAPACRSPWRRCRPSTRPTARRA